jgi:hypothetical protein
MIRMEKKLYHYDLILSLKELARAPSSKNPSTLLTRFFIKCKNIMLERLKDCFSQ